MALALLFGYLYLIADEEPVTNLKCIDGPELRAWIQISQTQGLARSVSASAFHSSDPSLMNSSEWRVENSSQYPKVCMLIPTIQKS